MSRPEPRDSAAWRPFRGPLAIKSRQDALTALKKFFGDLVAAQYLDHNAFAKIKVFLGTSFAVRTDHLVARGDRLVGAHIRA